MKSTHKVIRFDYSKYGSKIFGVNPDILKEYQFWGIHPKSGRLHVDIKRYIKMVNQLGANEYIFDGMKANRNTTYLVPKKINRYDYKVNIFRDLLNSLKQDWIEEYKPIFNMIKSPEQVYENSRLSRISTCSGSEDFDDIDVEARLDSFRRTPTYNKIINSLYCQFIQKIATEVDRFTLIFMKESGYKGKDFSFREFVSFTDGLIKDKTSIKIEKLPKYNAYCLLRKINNFLKHNSITAYNELKHRYPENVASIENGKSKIEYENGMFAGDWIILKKDYITNLLDKLIIFFENYCYEFLGEDLEESKWNYDEFFKDAVLNLWNVDAYLGI